jgi:hypothetical protein
MKRNRKHKEEEHTGQPDPVDNRERREPSDEKLQSLEYSETDEDENEGLGDGNIGRSHENLRDK